MKTLIYTNAFGKPEYLECARMMFESLRRVGYTGELALLTDQPEADRGGVVVHQAGGVSSKMAIRFFYDLAAYDFVLFADSDQLFLRNPELLFSEGLVRVASTGRPLRRFRFNTQFMTPAERHAIPRQSLCMNTCLVSMPGATAAKFLDLWERTHQAALQQHPPAECAYDGYQICRDQPALEAMVMRLQLEGVQGYPHVQLLPQEAVMWPAVSEGPEPSSSAVVAHFTGFEHSEEGKKQLVAMMREWSEQLERARP